MDIIDIDKKYVARIHSTPEKWIACVINGAELNELLHDAVSNTHLEVKEPYGNSHNYFIITKNILYISYFETTDKI